MGYIDSFFSFELVTFTREVREYRVRQAGAQPFFILPNSYDDIRSEKRSQSRLSYGEVSMAGARRNDDHFKCAV